MTRAIAADTRVAFVVEATDNVTPATPGFTVFRSTGESLSVDRSLVYSSELNGFRGEKNFAVAKAAGSGSLNFEWSYGTLDTFLESCLRNAWTANVLTDGKTAKTLTLEATYEDGATDTYKRLTGAQVGSMAFNLKAGEVVTGSAAFMSRGADFAQAAIAGATYTAGNTKAIQTGAAFGSLNMVGLTLDCLVSATVNINNNLREQMCLGSLAPTGVAAGKLEVNGSISMFLDSTVYNVLRAYADGTATSLEFVVGTTTLEKVKFEMLNVVLSNMKVEAQSAEGDVLVSADYRALQSSTLSGSVIRLTRNVA